MEPVWVEFVVRAISRTVFLRKAAKMNRVGFAILTLSVNILVLGPAGCVRSGPSGRSQYIVTEIGTLGGGTSSALAINDSGEIIGSSGDSMDHLHAFVWVRGNISNLGTLGGTTSEALGINKVGTVVGYSTVDKAGSIYHAFMWANGKMTDLSVGKSYSSRAHAINSRGIVVGELDQGSREQACYWDSRGMHSLPTPRGTNSVAVSVNETGDIVGDTYGSQYRDRRACEWVRGRFVVLAEPKGAVMAQASAVNDEGLVIGVFTDARGRRPCTWVISNPSSCTILGTSLGQPNRVNNHGEIIGDIPTEPGFGYGAVWQGNSPVSLNSGMVSSSAGWSFGPAVGVNDHGDIVGTGTHNSNFRGYLLTPVNPAAP